MGTSSCQSRGQSQLMTPAAWRKPCTHWTPLSQALVHRPQMQVCHRQPTKRRAPERGHSDNDHCCVSVQCAERLRGSDNAEAPDRRPHQILAQRIPWLGGQYNAPISLPAVPHQGSVQSEARGGQACQSAHEGPTDVPSHPPRSERQPASAANLAQEGAP